MELIDEKHYFCYYNIEKQDFISSKHVDMLDLMKFKNEST